MGLVESGKMPKPLTKLLNTARKYSLWMYQWGLACCAIEMGAAFMPRYDVMRLGVIPLPGQPPPVRPPRASPARSPTRWRCRCAASTSRCPTPST